MRKARSRRRIRNPNQVLTSRALNLTPGKPYLALKWLVTMCAVEFEFGSLHFPSSKAKSPEAGKVSSSDIDFFRFAYRLAPTSSIGLSPRRY